MHLFPLVRTKLHRPPVTAEIVCRKRLPAEQGAVVLQALNAAMDAESEAEVSDAPTDVTAVTSAAANRFAQRRAAGHAARATECFLDQSVDAADWTIHEGVLDLAVSGLMCLDQKRKEMASCAE